MSHWWRAHDECVDDPKLLLLSDRAHRAWFNLLCLASANGGTLPAMKVMVVKLRMKAPRIEAIICELKDAVLIDETETGLRPHNWDGRQYKSDVSTERVKRFRNGKRNVSETAPETEADTDPETEQITPSLRSDVARVQSRNAAFEQFWQDFPNKVGKQAASKAFVIVAKSGRVSFENLMAGLQRYVNKTDDRPWCNPATWLNQGRWDDKPATSGGRNGSSVIAAADRLVDKIAAFERGDEPDLLAEVRSGSGAVDVRLLPAK